MMTPYIGITGFTTSAEVAGVVAALPDETERLLMCGVLLSNALLAGEDSDAPNRCPHPDAIAAVFSDDSRCLNLIHYRPQPGANLADALARASEVGGPNCHGVQINATRGVPWPDPAALVKYRQRSRPRSASCCKPAVRPWPRWTATPAFWPAAAPSTTAS